MVFLCCSMLVRMVEGEDPCRTGVGDVTEKEDQGQVEEDVKVRPVM